MARLEAALIQGGFASYDEVAVRVADGDDPDEVLEALEQVCTIRSEGGKNAPNRCASLQSLYRSESATHAVAEARYIDVPEDVAKSLESLKGLFVLGESGRIKRAETGWTITVDPEGKATAGVLLRFKTAKAPTAKKPSIGSFARRFTEGLGVPVRLELGMISHLQADKWAHDEHEHVAPGMSVGRPINGSAFSAGTITVPVRLKNPPAVVDGENPPSCWLLTAAHPFHRAASRSKGAADVYQPATTSNPDRQIGQVVDAEYTHGYKATNLIDAALVACGSVPGRQFGRRPVITLAGVWDGELNEQSRTYIYGAASGLQAVRVDFALDVITTLLADDGTSLRYRDVIEFSRDGDNTRPASILGDSGAPLLVRQGDKYYLAGLVVGGGLRQAKSRRPRSYAVPIQRILLHFDADIW